jgi:hypothetical protein
MTLIVRRAVVSIIAVTAGAALLLLSVALTGEGLAFGGIIRSCIKPEGVLAPNGGSCSRRRSGHRVEGSALAARISTAQ